MEGNLKLLKELRAKGKNSSPRQMSSDEFMGEYSRRQEKKEEPASKGPSTRGGRRTSREEVIAERATTAMERNRAKLPSDRATNFRTQAEETGMTADERAEKAREYMGNIAMATGAARLGSAAASPYARTAGQFRRAGDKAAEMQGKILARKDIPSYSDRYRAGEEAARRRAEYRARKEAEKKLDEKLTADMEGGFRKGGKVKKYARGGGIEIRGKTRGRFV